MWIQKEKWWVTRKEPALRAKKRGKRIADRSPLAAPLLLAGGAAGHPVAGPQEQACLWVGRLQGQQWTLARTGERTLLRDGEGGLCLHSQRHDVTLSHTERYQYLRVYPGAKQWLGWEIWTSTDCEKEP